MARSFPLEHVSIEPDRGRERHRAVILIHGRGANEHDLLPLAEQLPDHLHVVSVRAPAPLGPGYTWYDLDLSGGGLHSSQPDPGDFERSLELLGNFVDVAVEEYGLDAAGIGLLGFSQGAILSLGSMIERRGGYSWIVALHGYLAERYDRDALERAEATPVFIGAGSQDQLIPATRAEEAAKRLAEAGVDVTFRTYPVGHGTSKQEVDDVSAWVAAREGVDQNR